MNKLIDTGAVAAAYCVADESIDAFRRFHAAPDRRVQYLVLQPVRPVIRR